MAFWKFTGAEAEYFPSIGLHALPGQVYDFGSRMPPPSPVSVWVSDSGPATDAARAGTALLGSASYTTQIAEHIPDIARAVTKFQSACQGLAIGLGADGTTYSLYHGIGSNRYAKFDLVRETTNPGGFALNQLCTLSVVWPTAGLGQTDTSWTYAGTWKSVTSAGAYTGAYRYAATANDAATWTTPAGVTAVGLRTVNYTNGGLSTVSIDGDPTRGSLLPTAQQVVTAGRYPASILVANGGSLNPADRVLDCYSSGFKNDVSMPIAEGLDPAAHTIVLTCTGYQRTAGGTGARLYITGGAYLTATTALTDAAALPTTVVLMNVTPAAWEYAILGYQTTAGANTWIGNWHGYEVQDSITAYRDGVPAGLTAGRAVAGAANVEIVRLSHLRHPDLGTTPLATCTVTYHVDRHGLRVDVSITWLVNFIANETYAMMPMSGMSLAPRQQTPQAHMDRATLMAMPGPVTMPGTSDTYYGFSKSSGGWLWDSTGDYAAIAWIPDVLSYTNNWALSAPRYAMVEDRAGALTKMYIARISAGGNHEPITGGDSVWSYSTRYLTTHFVGGADAALAAF